MLFYLIPLEILGMTTIVVNIIDIYSDVKWFFPKLKQGQILAIPN